jgi:hypothetical protein
MVLLLYSPVSESFYNHYFQMRKYPLQNFVFFLNFNTIGLFSILFFLIFFSVLENYDTEESAKCVDYLRSFVISILGLIEKLNSQNLISTLLQTVSLAISAVGRSIVPFVPEIMNFVSGMWSRSQGRPNVLSGIITIINNLVC